jgi:hypothetical protein
MKNMLLAIVALMLTVSAKAERNWVLDAQSIATILISNDVKPDAGPSYTKDSQALNLIFGYNAGDMEFGPILGYSNISVSGNSTKGTTLGGYFKYNFVPNVNINSIIPFGKFTLTSTNNETKSGTVTTDEKVFGWKLAGGATFFPFNNLVGIDGMLSYVNAKDSGSVANTTTGFQLGTAFNLYF